MNAKLDLLAASLILASAQATAADVRVGKAELLAPIAVETLSRDKSPHARRAHTTGPEDLRAYDRYDRVVLAGDAAEEAPFTRTAVRLYPVATAEPGGASAAPAGAVRAGKDAAPNARAAELPRPGGWAMMLAGLLGVGAIARRRMSV